MRHRLVPLLVASLFACEGGVSTTPGPSGPRIPASLAEVATTLDFADPPLVGEVRVRPLLESPDLRYAVDVDADGRPEEEGPLGDGVRVGYRFETAGIHQVIVRVHDGARQQSASQPLVVNDPDALAVLREAHLDFGVGNPPVGIAITSDEATVYVSAPEDDRILAVRGTGLGPLWRIDLPQGEGSGGLALSPDENTLYVDSGDSVVAVEISGAPRVMGAVGPAGWGAALQTLPDGSLLTGGDTGLARVQPDSREALAVYGKRAGPFAVSSDGSRVAFVSPRTVGNLLDATVVLLRSSDLSVIWSVPLSVGFPRDATAVPSRDGTVYAIVRSDRRRFFALEGSDGSIHHSLVLDRGDRLSYGTRLVRPAATTPDGRYVALVVDRASYVIDTSTHLPRFRSATGEACCGVAASGSRGVFFFANQIGYEIQKIELRP